MSWVAEAEREFLLFYYFGYDRKLFAGGGARATFLGELLSEGLRIPG